MSELQQFCVKCGGAISFDISQAGTSIFCLHCGQKVQLKSDSATPPEPSQSSPPLPAINDTPEEIFLLIDNQQHGPHSEATLSDYLKAGQVAPDALAWHEGAEGWKPLSEVLGAAAQPPATPLSPPAGGIPKRTMAGTAPAEEKPEDSEGGDPDQIRVTRKGEPIGPYSREKAKEYFASGQLLPTDWGWHDGMDDWKPLNEVLGPAAPTAIATECPNGHGETREWEG
jgi:DNA-directed RNA polymerase subunit RPC12/RpoP